MSRRRTPRWTEQQPLFAPASSCASRKRGYATREDAQRAIEFLRNLREEEGNERQEAREYLCQFADCARYHITSDSQRQLKAS